MLKHYREKHPGSFGLGQEVILEAKKESASQESGELGQMLASLAENLPKIESVKVELTNLDYSSNYATSR